MDFEKRCWAQISLDALRHNFQLVKSCAQSAKVMAVVKADGYGHGDVMAARLFENSGADAFAVSSFEEAVRLVNCKIKKPILVLGYTDPKRAKQLCEMDIRQTVYSLEYAKELSANAQDHGVCVKTHIKADTGMNRLGFGACVGFDNAIAEIKQVLNLKGICPEGLFTHFSVADSRDEGDIEFTQKQHELLLLASEALKNQDGASKFEYLHCSNSAATVMQPGFAHSLIRPGIILYGENPSRSVNLPGLRPAMQLNAVVSHVKTIPAGQFISYGHRYKSEDFVKVATLAVGYADGYPRSLSNKGVVDIHGKPCRILGTICMDQMMVDVTEVDNVCAGDCAIVFGGGAADTAQHAAGLANTIVYELLCGIGKRVTRVYVDNGKTVAVVDYLKQGGQFD